MSPARQERGKKIQMAIRQALESIPQTEVLEGSGTLVNNPSAPVSESEAIAAGVRAGAQTVCMVTVGQFGGRYLLTLLPPGWDSRTTVQYALRLIDVKTGAVLVDSVRERTAGGYLAIMTATYPEDFRADLSQVLSTKTQTRSGSGDD